MAATTYEHPLNERIRTLLRLESLFRRTHTALQEDSVWHSEVALHGLLNILELLSRSDLKSDVLKELERHQVTLSQLHNAPGVDQVRLDSTLTRLEGVRHALNESPSPLGQEVRELELVNTLMQKNSVIGGVCGFDLPLYQHWLSSPGPQRQDQLINWYQKLMPIAEAGSLLLSLLRESSDMHTCMAESGFFQQNLDSNIPFQLIRVTIDSELTCFPEISAGKHRFTVRFMQPRRNERPLQIDRNVDFNLCCCAL